MLNTNSDIAGQPPRQRILLTAYALFYRDGIRATGIDRVIAQAGVTKVTFYRHFPSKNDLILSFLEYRHQVWMAWFEDALQRHGGTLPALLPALTEWLQSADFRGCAFINTVGELGGMPQIGDITRRHKFDMTQAIASLLPNKEAGDASAIAMLVDGAIIRAQYEGDVEGALRAMQQALDWRLA